MSELKQNETIKDFDKLDATTYQSLRSMKTLQKFYPFATGDNYIADQELYKVLVATGTVATALEPLAPAEEESKNPPLSELTEADYNVLVKFNALQKVYPDATGKFEVDVPQVRRLRGYVHGDKDHFREIAEQNGMSEDAAREFSYCAYEVELAFDVDLHTGHAKLVEVDGKPLAS